MAKVGSSAQFTFRPVPKDQYTYAKVVVEVTDIDTDQEIAPQMEKVQTTLAEVWQYVLDKIDLDIDDIRRKAGVDVDAEDA